jgi:putative heme-binding domain-containing protein
MPGFVDKIRSEAIATLSESERSELASLLDPPSLADEPSQPARTFVRKWAIDDFNQPRSNYHPELDRGRVLFDAATCSRCHRVGQHGTWVGPDLTFVSHRFGRRDLLESILSPSRVVAENYRAARIVTTDGRILIGRILPSGDYRSPSLRLAVDPNSPHTSVEVQKNQIESHEMLPISWMPEGLLDTLSETEILDLLAYIEAGGRP